MVQHNDLHSLSKLTFELNNFIKIDMSTIKIKIIKPTMCLANNQHLVSLASVVYTLGVSSGSLVYTFGVFNRNAKI